MSASRSQRQRPRLAAHQQRGIALLVAILLVALGTIIAAAVAYENVMTARRGTATFALDQALLIGEGAEALAAYGLRQIKTNTRGSSSQDIYVGQGWDKPYGPLEVVPGVMLTAGLEDAQGRFNLNNLVRPDDSPDPVQIAAFTKLLELVGLEPKWAGFVVDWIDMDIAPSNPDGAEDSVYMGQTPPYRTANRYITSTTELLALPGFGADRYKRLAPYLSALPYGTQLNVCTADPVVLDAFGPQGVNQYSSDVEQFTKNRAAAAGCFPTLATFRQGVATAGQPPVPGTTPQVPGGGQGGGTGSNQPFGTTSQYFRLTSFITIGSAEFNLYSLLYQDGTGAVRPIQRSFTPD
ncbi:MAG TPA: type II secretion system minor pseudopilin GspK [Steroidobacteraceae bacterium]|nr:type II secretion system minor pseudopilin GspK [Steroidobacteraceae bacterium]